MIEAMFYLLGIRAIFKLIFISVTIIQILKASQERSPSAILTNGRRIVVLVKVFCETERAQELIARLRYLVSFDPGISAIIVGTERERVGSVNPTLEKMRQLAIDCDRISIIEARGDRSNSRPGQVNFALDFIKTDPSTTWVLHLDSDTDLSSLGIVQFIRAINRDRALILQSSFFSKNFKDISYLQKGHSLLQSRWTLSHELLRIRLSRYFPFLLTHLVGHGSCILLQKLRDFGNWPEGLETEDIELGFYFCVAGEPVASSPVIGSSDSPKTLISGFQQELAWSFGALNYFRYWVNYLQRFVARSKFRLAIMTIQGIVLWANWMLLSWIVALALIYSLLLESDAATIFLFFFFLEYFVSCFFCFIWAGLGKKCLFLKFIPAILFSIFRRSISANLGFFYFLVVGRIRDHKTR